MHNPYANQFLLFKMSSWDENSRPHGEEMIGMIDLGEKMVKAILEMVGVHNATKAACQGINILHRRFTLSFPIDPVWVSQEHMELDRKQEVRQATDMPHEWASHALSLYDTWEDVTPPEECSVEINDWSMVIHAHNYYGVRWTSPRIDLKDLGIDTPS